MMVPDVPHGAAAAYRADLEHVEADLIATIRRHARAFGVRLTAHALVEVTGSVLAEFVEAEPDRAAAIGELVGQLALFVQTTNARPQ